MDRKGSRNQQDQENSDRPLYDPVLFRFLGEIEREDFVDRLPEYMRGALQKVCSVNMFPVSERTAKSIAHVFVWEV